jgi:hypothetical protein
MGTASYIVEVLEDKADLVQHFVRRELIAVLKS